MYYKKRNKTFTANLIKLLSIFSFFFFLFFDIDIELGKKYCYTLMNRIFYSALVKPLLLTFSQTTTPSQS